MRPGPSCPRCPRRSRNRRPSPTAPGPAHDLDRELAETAAHRRRLAHAHPDLLHPREVQHLGGDSFGDRLKETVLLLLDDLADQLADVEVIDAALEVVTAGSLAQVRADFEVHAVAPPELALGVHVAVVAVETHLAEHQPGTVGQS